MAVPATWVPARRSSSLARSWPVAVDRGSASPCAGCSWRGLCSGAERGPGVAGALRGGDVSFLGVEGECVLGRPGGLGSVPARRERRSEIGEDVGPKWQQVGRAQQQVGVGGERNRVVCLPARG